MNSIKKLFTSNRHWPKRQKDDSTLVRQDLRGPSPFDRIPNDLLAIILSYLDHVSVQRSRQVSRRFCDVYRNNLELMNLPHIQANVRLNRYYERHKRKRKMICIDVQGRNRNWDYDYSCYLTCQAKSASANFHRHSVRDCQESSVFYQKRGIKTKQVEHGCCIRYVDIDYKIRTKSLEKALEAHLEFITQFFAKIKVEKRPATWKSMAYEEFLSIFTKIVERRKFWIRRIYFDSENDRDANSRAATFDCFNVLYNNKCRMFSIVERRDPEEILKILLNPFEENEEDSLLRKMWQHCRDRRLVVSTMEFTSVATDHLVANVLFSKNSIGTARIKIFSNSLPHFVHRLVDILYNELGFCHFVIDETCGFEWIFSTPIKELHVVNMEIYNFSNNRSNDFKMRRETIFKIFNKWHRGMVEIMNIRFAYHPGDLSIDDLRQMNAEIVFQDEDKKFVNSTLRRDFGNESLNIIMNEKSSTEYWATLTSSDYPALYNACLGARKSWEIPYSWSDY